MSRTADRVRGRRGVLLRILVKERDQVCRRCYAVGRISEIDEIDHIVPLEHGGSNEPENMQGLCARCHREKTTGRNYSTQINEYGLPVDPNHPFYRMERK